METKKARGIAKGVVTRKINEITDLMTDENNADEVNKKANELKDAFENFQAAHRTFHSELIEREAIEESTSYYDLVFGIARKCRRLAHGDRNDQANKLFPGASQTRR